MFPPNLMWLMMSMVVKQGEECGCVFSYRKRGGGMHSASRNNGSLRKYFKQLYEIFKIFRGKKKRTLWLPSLLGMQSAYNHNEPVRRLFQGECVLFYIRGKMLWSPATHNLSCYRPLVMTALFKAIVMGFKDIRLIVLWLPALSPSIVVK